MAVSGFTKGELVNKRYEVREKIGEGGFSVVYKGLRQITREGGRHQSVLSTPRDVR